MLISALKPRLRLFAIVLTPAAVLFLGNLLGGSLTAPASSHAEKTPPLNGFDLSQAVIPVEDIVSGGVARDAIPAIDSPKFLSPDEADFLHPDDLVVSVTLSGRTRAYPLRILAWHEIVNDQLGAAAIAVTYCPLCNTAMVFDRVVDQRLLTFGVSGLLYQSDVLLYDRQTESLWSQLAVRAVSGRLRQSQLTWLTSEHLTWAAWKAKYPQGEVLSTQTGFQRDYSENPYADYERSPEVRAKAPSHRQDLPAKSLVLGIVISGHAKAYPIDRLPASRPVPDILGSANIEVSYDPVAKRPLVADLNRVVTLPYVVGYWFAWQAFYPETDVWKP
ncbi:MAG: DUF3179 domain-containing protein [Verrucomicrobia bacterium]|nr:DUF3179 domain-containing protein [Verrucomicrobiota bacterium]